MAVSNHNKYRDEALRPFAEKLVNEYYNSLETLCGNAKTQAKKVHNLEIEQMASDYATLCNNVILETEHHIHARKEKIIPYVHELSEKVSSSHDCSNCSGSCKLNHELQVVELNASNTDMKKMLSRLQLASLPLYSQTIYPDEYRILRNRMALIEMNLTELFFLENNYLIPKIIEAQKTIRSNDKRS